MPRSAWNRVPAAMMSPAANREAPPGPGSASATRHARPGLSGRERGAQARGARARDHHVVVRHCAYFFQSRAVRAAAMTSLPV